MESLYYRIVNNEIKMQVCTLSPDPSSAIKPLCLQGRYCRNLVTSMQNNNHHRSFPLSPLCGDMMLLQDSNHIHVTALTQVHQCILHHALWAQPESVDLRSLAYCTLGI